MNSGGIGKEVVVAERLGLGPEEEAEDKMGIVFELEGNLGKLSWVEAVRVDRPEVIPARF